MEKRIGFELRELQQLLHRQMEAHRLQNANNLTHIQNRILGYIFKNSSRDIFQKDIEKELNIRRSTATQMLKPLERDGYLQRISVPSDARLKKIVLTDKALSLQDEIFNHVEQTEKILRKGISEKDMNTFFSVIQQIKHNLDEEKYK